MTSPLLNSASNVSKGAQYGALDEMVPIPSTDNASSRGKRLLAANSKNSDLFLQRPERAPLKTYGKKDSRPLSLTAKQFRSDAFDIPSDNEDDSSSRRDTTSDFLEAIEQDARALDSPLSSAEYSSDPRSLREGHNRHGARSKYFPARDVRSTQPSTVNGTARSKKDTAKPIKTPKKQPVYPPAPGRRNNATVAQRDRAIQEREPRATRTKKHLEASKATQARRLPVNELFLVKSPISAACNVEARSTPSGIQTQDQIHDEFSSPLKRRSPENREDDTTNDRPPKIPVSALRARFKSRKLAFKNVQGAHRSTRLYHSPSSEHLHSRGRDGFEDSELAVKTKSRKVKRRHKEPPHLSERIAALQLGRGRLPHVEFKSSSMALELTLQSDTPGHMNTPQLDREDTARLPSSASIHRVRVNDRLREDRIRAELSSISAPERAHSESEDSERESEEEEELEPEGIARDELIEISSGILSMENNLARSSSVQVVAQHRGQDAAQACSQQRNSPWRMKNPGVTLDFRQPVVPGQLPRQSLGRRNLMEVKRPSLRYKSRSLQSTTIFMRSVVLV